MRRFKIIILSISLLLIIAASALPTIYSRTVIRFFGEPDPHVLEKIYGEFDVEISDSNRVKCYAYQTNIPLIHNKERYLVIKHYTPKADEPYIEIYTYEGTDWLTGGQK